MQSLTWPHWGTEPPPEGFDGVEVAGGGTLVVVVEEGGEGAVDPPPQAVPVRRMFFASWA